MWCSVDIFQCRKTTSERRVFVLLTATIYTRKTSYEHCINLLGKTKENATENKVFIGVCWEQENNELVAYFSWHSHKENAELTERFPISQNGWLIREFPDILHLVKLTVMEGFFAVMENWVVWRKANGKLCLCILRKPSRLKSMYTKMRPKAPEKS